MLRILYLIKNRLFPSYYAICEAYYFICIFRNRSFQLIKQRRYPIHLELELNGIKDNAELTYLLKVLGTRFIGEHLQNAMK